MFMTDQTRQGALNLINRIRSQVALGQFQAEAFLPSANDMEKLRWDCNLEKMAQTAVINCPRNPPPASVTNGMNYFAFGPGAMMDNAIEFAILDWTDITSMMWPADNIYNGNPALLYFANLIRATTTAVGCASTACGNRAAAACVFSQPNVQPGTLVYTAGNPCQNDDECIAFAPAFCDFGLCVSATRPTTTMMTTTVPLATTTLLPTTTTSSPTTTTTTSPTTTTRKKSTECSSTAFSSAFRETVLGMHNNFRSLVARGRAVNAEHPGEFAPPSSRMDLLEYDCTAEAFAHNHVRSCDRMESSPAARPGYQENIHILGTTATDDLGAIQNVGH
uniref:SCP domain-containing protein n=1 Tax=Angiostrongylus cantonensis TaxID=6313 RepID=A0A0K0DN40_ANGCA